MNKKVFTILHSELLFLFVKRLHSSVNIMSLVVVKKRKKWEKIGKVEIKWIEK